MIRKRLVWSGLAVLGVLFTLTDCTASVQRVLAIEMRLLVHPGMEASDAQAVLAKDGFRCEPSNEPDRLLELRGHALPAATSWLICRRDRNDKIIATCAQFVNVALGADGQFVLATLTEQPRCTSV